MNEAEFKDTILNLNNVLKTLSDEAKDLEKQITDNLNKLFMD